MVARIGIAHQGLRLVAAATTVLLLLSGTAAAQLALSGSMPVAGTAIPFGATGLDSPGLSPAPTSTPTGNGTICSAMGNLSSGLSGNNAIYDGGGLGMGGSSPANPTTCDATSGNSASSAATVASPPSPGGMSPAGIPLGSVEISNAGVSPPIAVPAPSFSMPTTNGLLSPTVGTGIPCTITGSSMPATGC